MNAKRREAIRKLADQIDDLRWRLETLRDEEQEYFDNIPENLQGGERYETAEQAVDSLDSAVDELSSVYDNLIEIIEN